MADDSVADDILRNGFDRWQRLEGEKQAISDDLKELFSELKNQGFDGKALRAAFRDVAKVDDADVQEHNAVVDLYVNSLLRGRGAKVGTVPATRSRAARETENEDRNDALAALRANPAMSIVDPTHLKNKSNLQNMQSAQTIPAAAEAQRSTPVDDVGSSGEAPIQSAPQAGSDLTQAPAYDQSQVATQFEANSPASNEAPMEVYGASVEGATAPLSESGDILPGGALPETLDGADQPPAEINQPETANDDRSCVSVLGGLAQSLQQQATREGEAARPLPPTVYAEPGVIVWETTPPEGVERGAISKAFGTMGQDLTVIADDLEKANAAPIVKKGKVILDGWARYMAVRNMTELDGSPVAYPVVQYDGSDILTDIIKLNVEGRILTDDQKRKIAANLARQEPSRKDDIYRAFELWMEPV
ncbi:MAG: DUF2312 domain-containing protein [Candidatus Devosia phytovorans]|uniref:DUF2312 domain-containing protein n=1 Tax=Candidatus Devosia phytovorans TaxID=3121372 RepID=A0AAJ6B1V0_9HYPH|nr:GapR family DNA-binding domain-containing protein [Devosia sp.]WEK05739.1 MAG: DUF2312 domain-containing protein [Devosia sp.]